ncbi:MAG: hypothetical protein HY698_06180 [Deltaproteobacteria bacterium]|nr:hypothetical protein [Deltaproteobacteria bacterium]
MSDDRIETLYRLSEEMGVTMTKILESAIDRIDEVHRKHPEESFRKLFKRF